ncbi:MAG: hypothetical protein JSW12_16115 [Deltaproteobacteria bacterium]|nr:MAG: hypothetical protein JSW12_16115 [Deltaproteobacteria bacterium]
MRIPSRAFSADNLKLMEIQVLFSFKIFQIGINVNPKLSTYNVSKQELLCNVYICKGNLGILRSRKAVPPMANEPRVKD